MENELFRIIIASHKKLIYLQYKILAKMRRQGIVERIRSEASKMKPKVQTILYGSEARGDARPDSDIDLLMLVDADKLTYSEKDRIIAPFYDIELDTGVIISIIVMLRKEWENHPFITPFQYNVRNEGITL
jgi:predicted nucleotidyltransferase